MIDALLQSLGLAPTNAGTWSGDGGWLDDAVGEAHRVDQSDDRRGHRDACVRRPPRSTSR